MKLNKFFLLFLLVLFLSGKASAVPAYPYPIKITQPNGEEITVKMKGDEWMKGMESEDGYSLLYDEDNYIVYATQNEKGDLTPSKIIARDVELRSDEAKILLKNTPKNLQYSKEQREILLQMRNITEKATLRSRSPQSTIETAKAICALIGFPDKPFQYTQEDFDKLMNQVGYRKGIQKGSVKDFYLENSYGQLELIVTVTGPYTAKYNHAFYGENDKNEQDMYPDSLAREAADFAFNEPTINPADFDNDGDGYIDTFHFLYAGYGEEAGAPANCIWAHKYGFWPALTYGRKKLDTYSCSPELRGSTGTNITYIGPICHELCHVFGAPDYYDTDGEGNGGDFTGTGNWDLMATGSWNNDGATPAHINMFQKMGFGWVNPVELTLPQTIKEMPNSAENPVAYVIKSTNPNEYYVLENRQKTGFDAGVPGAGLLIYHVNYKASDFWQNTVNNKHPQGVYVVAANSTNEIPTGTPASYGLINNAGCAFPGTGIPAKADFTDQSVPSAFLWSGDKLGKTVTNITKTGKFVSFDFMSPVLNLNLKAQLVEDKITLTWEKPASEKQITGYKVYFNDQLVLRTTGTAYRRTVTAEGTYIFGVSVLFENGEESAVQEVEIIVNWTAINPIQSNPALVYPNSIKQGETINLDMGDNISNAGLSVYTLSGQLVLQKQVNTQYSQHIIDLPKGIYILKIEHNTSDRTDLTRNLRLIVN
ncbi:MAG: M6 family metalloprotease domain-containing protein [Candidatus Symbiothrix sp.]|jgi:M6 family metalloprotease-like protein|nr:M6 family metalloprotease domain-containing protein [Candidatus Symbiothrix sp.]